MERQQGKTVITMETFQRTTIRSRKTAKIVLCERCAAGQSPSDTAAHLQIVREALLEIENGELEPFGSLPSLADSDDGKE